MNEQGQQVFEEVQYLNGENWKLEAVLPQGEDDGFFLMSPEGRPAHVGPNRVKAITVELFTGHVIRAVVRRKYGTNEQLANSFEGQLARCLKALWESNSELIKIEKGIGRRQGAVKYISYQNLAQAFNASLSDYKGKSLAKAQTVGSICRDTFEMPVMRLSAGWVVVLMDEKFSGPWFNLPFPPSQDVIEGNNNGLDPNNG